MPSHEWIDDHEWAEEVAADLCGTLDVVAEASGLNDDSPDPILLLASTRGAFIKIVVGERSRVFDATEGDSEPIAWMRSTVKAAVRRARKVR